MKGPVPSIRHSSKVSVPEVKEKRKCGRPRNPIPRHKRVSHINAEHRRRGKIQNGFQTLKNMVPKYESSGRDSKADILTKSVEYCKSMKKQVKEQQSMLKELRAEKEALSADIERHQQTLPEGQLFEDQPLEPEQRFNRYVNQRTMDNYKYFILGYLMRPLHSAFHQTTDTATAQAFTDTSLDWAKDNLSQQNLRKVCTQALSQLCTETCIMKSPESFPQEAVERSQHDCAPLLPCPLPSPSPSPSLSAHKSRAKHSTGHKHHSGSSKHHSSSSKHHSKHHSSSGSSKNHVTHHSHSHKGSSGHKTKSSSGHKRSSHAGTSFLFEEAPSKKTKSSSRTASTLVSAPVIAETVCSISVKSEAAAAVTIKRESASPSCRAETVASCGRASSSDCQPLSSALSPASSYDSAIGLSPLDGGYQCSVFNELQGYDSVDQGYDTNYDTNYDAASFSSTGSPIRAEGQQSVHPLPISGQSTIFADFENPPDFLDFHSLEPSSSTCFPSQLPHHVNNGPQHQHQLTLPADAPQFALYGEAEGGSLALGGTLSFFDQADTKLLLDSVDQDLLNDPSVLLDVADKSFLNGGSFSDLLWDWDASDLPLGEHGLTGLS